MNKIEKTSTGVIVWLSSELMFFSGIFAMYFTLRSTVGDVKWREYSDSLNVPYALINTIVLVLSSVTCQMALYADEKKQERRSVLLFGLTMFLGIFFLLGQVIEYTSLTKEHVLISSSSWSSAFYLATGIHWLHVLGGVFALFFLIGKKRARTSSLVESFVISYYWHFVDIVWIVLFTVIYILR